MIYSYVAFQTPTLFIMYGRESAGGFNKMNEDYIQLMHLITPRALVYCSFESLSFL